MMFQLAAAVIAACSGLAHISAYADSKQQPTALIYADVASVDMKIKDVGTWEIGPSEAVWSLVIHRPGAANLSVFISEYKAPVGARLIIGDALPRSGEFTSHRSWPVRGDRLTIRLHVPADAVDDVGLTVSEIYAGKHPSDLDI